MEVFRPRCRLPPTPELLDQHLLADPLDFSPQLSEPPWLRVKRHKISTSTCLHNVAGGFKAATVSVLSSSSSTHCQGRCTYQMVGT